MASDDFSIKTKITLDTKNYEAGIKKAESATQKFSSSLSGVTKLLKSTFAIAGISVGTKAIVNFGKEAVKSAESANKTLNILNNTLKVTGASAWTTSEDLVKMSEEIAYSTNYTVGEIQDMQSVLLGFKNITGDTFREASDAITDMATVMGMDLKSAVQTVGKALDDPIKGLDSLRRQGFAFTEEQKAELEILVRNGEQLKAQKIILDELNTTYGGAAKAAQSAFDKQKDSVIEFKETLGNQLMPVMNKFAESSATTFNKLTEFVKTIDFTEIAATIEYTVDIIKEYLNLFYENFKELFRGLGIEIKSSERFFETWKNNLYNILNGVYKQIQLAFGFIKALINGDWKLAWEYAKIYVLEVCKKILDGLDNLLGKMPDLVNGAIKGLNAYYEAQDKVLIDFFHLPEKYFKAPRIGLYNGENLIDTKSIQKEIDKATKYIEEATGKQVTINLTGLEEIDNKRKEYQKSAEEGEIHLTSTTEIQVKKRTSLFSQESENIIASWKKVVEDLKNKTKDWTEVITSVLSEASNAFGEMFTMIGENLVGAGHSYEDFASVALNSLAQVLQSLGAQLAAIAAVKAMAYSYGEAVAAAAASAAAFTASGIASGTAKALTKTKDKIDSIVYTLKDFNSTAAVTIQKVKELKENLNSLTTGSQYTPSSYFTEYNTAKKIQEGYVESIKALEKQIEETWNSMSGFEREKWDWLNYGNAKIYKELKKQLEEAKKGLVDINNYLTDVLSNVLNNIKAQGDAINDEINSYKTLYNSYDKVMEYYKKIQEIQNEYGKTSTDFVETLENIALMTTKFISTTLEYSDFFTQYKIILQEQKNNILSTINSIVQSLAKSGANIGEAIITSLIDGGTKKDFLTSMKDYIRENLLKLAVYTESFQDRLAEVGTKLTATLLGGGSVKGIRKELEDLWDTASKQAERAEAIIAEAFGDIQEVVEESADGVEESLDKIDEKLSSFTEAMNRFKEDVSDLGGDIATNLVDGISDGLSQSDFLDNMKKWIRKMLVQSVVYTNSMKAEIEAIGQAITKGLSEGFTETTFHEIRRDLSWVFNQANQTIEGIDNILNSVFGNGYATGTNNATSGLHLVGEAGPELVRFRGGEQVINSNNTNKALAGMGGKTNNFNVTFNNLQDTTAFAMMNQLKQYNRAMAINGVM